MPHTHTHRDHKQQGVKETSPVSACGCERMVSYAVRKRKTNLRDEDGLVVAILEHVMVGCVRDGKDMRRHLVPLFVLVREHDLVGVDPQFAVRVHCHQEESRICLLEHTERNKVPQIIEHGVQAWLSVA